MTQPTLRGQVALLTGASRGLGVVIAHTLAREGIHLALLARSSAPLQQLAGELGALGVRAPTFLGESRPSDVAEGVLTAISRDGR